MRRSGFTSKASWKRLQRKKSINKIGPKTEAWNNTRAELKIEFEFQYGITTCELQYQGCWRDNALGFAHAAKRRKLTAEDLGHVILACNPCHDRLEVKSPKEMKGIVDTICQQRESMLINRQSSAL